MATSESKIKFAFSSKPKGPLGKSPAANFVPKKNDGREKIECIENNTIKTSGASDGNETLEQRAAREIVEETAEAIVKKEEQGNFVVPLRPELLPLDGARQSNLDDYESIPIEKFGLAMLRGMGFKESSGNENDKQTPGPTPRPKGLGLGAERAVKEGIGAGNNRTTVQGENLVMKCGVPVKIAMGKHQGKYGLFSHQRVVML
uniref:G-patch_2 domain-containing protein n=1 Tax=Anopheles christyi TaxID=43041 RepID=A0A182K675_9DIPT